MGLRESRLRSVGFSATLARLYQISQVSNLRQFYHNGSPWYHQCATQCFSSSLPGFPGFPHLWAVATRSEAKQNKTKFKEFVKNYILAQRDSTSSISMWFIMIQYILTHFSLQHIFYGNLLIYRCILPMFLGFALSSVLPGLVCQQNSLLLQCMPRSWNRFRNERTKAKRKFVKIPKCPRKRPLQNLCNQEMAGKPEGNVLVCF